MNEPEVLEFSPAALLGAFLNETDDDDAHADGWPLLCLLRHPSYRGERDALHLERFEPEEVEGCPVKEPRWSYAGASVAYHEVNEAFLALQNSLHVSAKQPGKAAFKRPDGKGYTHLSWTKALRRLLAELPLLKVNPARIERWQALMASIGRLDGYEFTVVRGYDVMDAYDEDDFGSCMSYTSMTELYAENPLKVGALTLRRENGELAARALVWTLDDGRTYVDRVYPDNSGPHLLAIDKWVRENGYVSYRTGGLGRATVTLTDVNAYPYLDTFYGVLETPFERDDGKFVLSSGGSPHGIHMTSTEGECPWDDAYVRLINGFRVHEDDAVYDHDMGGYVHVEDTVEVENSWTRFYVENGYVVEPVGDPGIFLYVGSHNYHPRNHNYVELTAGAHRGEWAHMEDSYHVDFPEGPEWVHGDDLDAVLGERGYSAAAYRENLDLIKLPVAGEVNSQPQLLEAAHD